MSEFGIDTTTKLVISRIEAYGRKLLDEATTEEERDKYTRLIILTETLLSKVLDKKDAEELQRQQAGL